MSMFSEFHFIRPAWLLLLPVVVALWWWKHKSQDPLRGWREVMDRELLEALTVGQQGGTRWRELGLLAAWLFAVIAVAGPTWRPEPSPFADDPIPVVLVLRAAETMDLSDLTPSRMERARLKVADFATERKGQPLGLVAYAGSSHLVLPPTRDTSVIATMAAEISPAIMPATGDDLIGALELSAGLLKESGGSIVVVADTSTMSDHNALTEFRNKYRIPVFFLAVARADTPELDAIFGVAESLRANVTIMTPDNKDILQLVRATAQAPVAVGVAGEGVRWAEAGWWLLPIITLLSLASFRRTLSVTSQEASA